MAELYPDLMTCRFNLRQVAKELCCLQKHLNDPRQYCQDCIGKHVLTVEALLDEGVTLDGSEQERELARLARADYEAYILIPLRKGENPADAVRALNKALRRAVGY